jgi:hypothetical protein
LYSDKFDSNEYLIFSPQELNYRVLRLQMVLLVEPHLRTSGLTKNRLQFNFFHTNDPRDQENLESLNNFCQLHILMCIVPLVLVFSLGNRGISAINQKLWLILKCLTDIKEM